VGSDYGVGWIVTFLICMLIVYARKQNEPTIERKNEDDAERIAAQIPARTNTRGQDANVRREDNGTTESRIMIQITASISAG
jgi:hypothetical protein